jgi:chemosensory pili system protein ChpA (sensor histidine kinase/response regulator)
MQSGSITPTALGWVRNDLDRLLGALRQQVEAIAANPGAGPALFTGALGSSEELAQIFNTLVADGPHQVSSEVFNLVKCMHDGKVNAADAANSALMDAIVVLPAYIDRLQSGHHDLPILLLPLINRLRSASGTDELTEGTVFSPLLDVELPELEFVRKPGFDEPFEFLTARLHRQYETALQSWLAQQEAPNLLSAVQGICETMRHRVQRYDLKRLWWVATEVVGGLLDGKVANDTNLRRLLARVGLLIRNMSEQGEDGINERSSTSITQALLYHIGKAEPGSKGVDLVRQRFELDELAPDSEAMMRARGNLSGRDRDMYQSLSSAVEDELAIVKDSLDLELRTGEVDKEQRGQSMEALARLSDTLGMLGLSGPGQSIRSLIPQFEATASAERDQREATLVGLAEQLLLVESALHEQVETLGEPVGESSGESFTSLSAFELRRIHCHLLDECVASMQAAQDGVRNRLAGRGDADPYQPLEQMAGALELSGEAKAATLTSWLDGAIRKLFDNPEREREHSREMVDTLADAMAALELYLAARRDQQHDAGHFLSVMNARLELLDELNEQNQADARPAPAPAAPEPAAPEQPATPPPATEAAAAAENATAGQATTQAKPSATAAEPAPTPPAAPASAPDPKKDRLPPPVDPELRDIFLEEYETVLETLQQHIPEWMTEFENVEALTEIRRAFHTLKGSGRMVGADELGDFSWQIERMLNTLLEGRSKNFADAAVMVRIAQATLPALRQRMLQESAGLTSGLIEMIGNAAAALSERQASDWPTLKKHLPMYLAGILPDAYEQEQESEQQPGEDDETDSVVRTELAQNLEPVRELLDAISQDRSTRASKDQVRAVHTIAGLLAAYPEGRDAEIAKALEGLLENQARTGKAFTQDAMFTLLSAVGELQNRLERLDGHGELSSGEEQQALLSQLATLTPHFDGPATAPEEPAPEAEDPARAKRKDDSFDPGRSVFARGAEEPLSEWQPAGEATATPPEPAAAPLAQPAPPATEQLTVADLDQEIIAIFLEEASEVLERGDAALNQWRDDLQQLSWVQNLQREIHTFKGGARMAGLNSIGEYSHEMETLLERIALKQMAPSLSAVQILEEAGDRLQGWVEQVAAGQIPQAETELALLKGQIEALDGVGSRPASPKPAAPPPVREVPEVPEAPEPAETSPSARPAAPATAPAEPGANHIRVSADLLDRMVNAAGEVSIYRSRIEQQFGGMRANLGEFEKTIERLREQFRQLEIEIESQIRSNYPDAPAAGEEAFDPLEMDQFSGLQQASRSLSESVSDLLSLQEMLEENARSSEQLLQRQSRASTELQEGLMKTRMVPFSSIAPRLRRIVRGSAQESAKQAQLRINIVGTSDELDRNVLEHIVTPLEHMMRNAIVHGIESPAERQAAGKPAEGEIIITVESEATEFVIRIADDGAGVNTDAIQARAIERGLLAADAQPSRQQLYEFMMNSGFSTTETVTKLAGRGVGMDVVSSDIKQIGGSLEIESERGQGTQFTIRIPFTLAIMQAIGAVAGQQRYLVPLSSVMGVARLLPAEYKRLVDTPEPVYRYAGQEYPVLDIEPLLGESATPLSRDNVSLLILRAGEQKAAIRAPRLLPHREVVIKPVGPQISSIPGILGGSISAEGEVIVILDPGPLIRHALIHGSAAAAEPLPVAAGPQRTLVMVIDDSITMRKVTSRVLEGLNFEVMTAKDGVDALEQMQERTPDIILCDIEMPRMDGYELTERARDDSRLRAIPIIMITSRAGQKHRDRAMRAGANAYLTKPYQENDLINEIERLLAEEPATNG